MSESIPETDRTYTAAEASRITGVPDRTIRKRIEEGQLPFSLLKRATGRPARLVSLADVQLICVANERKPRTWKRDGCDTRAGSIYGLLCPKTGRLRYIGKTGISVQKRFNDHEHAAIKRNSSMPVHRWWRKLAKAGLKPVVKVLAECLPGTMDSIESEMIAAHRRKYGRQILNVESGGEGGEWSDERRAEHSESCAARNQMPATTDRWKASQIERHARRLGMTSEQYLVHKADEQMRRGWNSLLNKYNMLLSRVRAKRLAKNRAGRAISICDGLAYLRLTRGQEAIIDASDVAVVAGTQWFAQLHRGKYRAKRNIRHKSEFLQWLIVNRQPGQMVIVKNGNPLDCRRSNLQVV